MESGERLKKLFKKLFKKVLTKGMECDIISELCAKHTAITENREVKNHEKNLKNFSKRY